MKKNVLIVAGICAVVVVFVVMVAVAIFASKGELSPESGRSNLEKRLKKINVTENSLVPGVVDLSGDNLEKLYDALPEITKYPELVKGADADIVVEILSSTEKATVKSSGTNNDKALVDMADTFNKTGVTINGKSVAIQVRGIPSGQIADYLRTGKYVPTAISPSNRLWGDMLQADITLELVDEGLMSNTAGIVLTEDKNKEITEKYGSVSVESISQAIIAGEVNFGYTNPFVSSTGANFLLSALNSFDSENPLGSKAKEQFDLMQANIPFVSFTTLQMSDAAESGVLDGFVYESQQMNNTPEIKDNYVFTPFGVRHDNPLYAVGDVSDTELEILRAFAAFCHTDEMQKIATDMGFNTHADYSDGALNITGTSLSSAQKFWKENKNNSQEIIAVFVADLSGSMMENNRLTRLKDSLRNSMGNINEETSIGIVTFSDDVQIALPVGKFGFEQQKYFAGAVQNFRLGGGTAMFDGIVVAADMLLKAGDANPNARLMMFVLTDGETNIGLEWRQVEKDLKAVNIPIHTIGYDANIDVLQPLASLNEASFMDADTNDIVYRLTSLFNAEL